MSENIGKAILIARDISLSGVAIAAAVVFSVTAASAQSSKALERRGESLLSQHCAMCHAIGTTGSSPHPMAPPFRTLSQHYPIQSLEEGLGEGLLSGHPDMPEFVFPPHDVGAIIRYLESIQQR